MALLDELLRLKSHREDKASRALAADRAALAETERLERSAGDALEDYRAWAERHERELYAELCRRVVQPREIEWLKQDVAGLKTKESELEGLLAKAGERRGQAEQALARAREAHAQALRAREKFTRLLEAQAQAARLESERLEDVEAEDLQGTRGVAPSQGEDA
jgi:type III secretion protein O